MWSYNETSEIMRNIWCAVPLNAFCILLCIGFQPKLLQLVGLWFRKPIMSSPSASHWNDALHNNNTRERKKTQTKCPQTCPCLQHDKRISAPSVLFMQLCNFKFVHSFANIKENGFNQICQGFAGLMCATSTRRRQLPRHGFGNKVAAYGRARSVITERAGIVTHAWLLHTRPRKPLCIYISYTCCWMMQPDRILHVVSWWGGGGGGALVAQSS